MTRRCAGWSANRAITGSAASASQMGRFETEWLTQPKNLAALADLPGQWIDSVRARRPPKSVVLDMDSSESPTYGEQEGSAYNGHFGCTCHHPAFVFNQLGDLERCALRPGNVHSADGWREVLEPVIVRYGDKVKRRYFRGDAAFANPKIYEFLEAEVMGYAIRLAANRVLQNFIRTLVMPKAAEPWSLTSLREKLIKIGARVASHGRYVASRWPRSRCRGRCSKKFSRLSPGCGRRPRQHEGRWDRMRQTTMAEVRLDEGKATSSRAARRPNIASDPSRVQLCCHRRRKNPTVALAGRGV